MDPRTSMDKGMMLLNMTFMGNWKLIDDRTTLISLFLSMLCCILLT